VPDLATHLSPFSRRLPQKKSLIRRRFFNGALLPKIWEELFFQC
jgi:hypothetical protein